MICEGFDAPMDNFPVSAEAQKNKKPVFPLRAKIIDDQGFEVTANDLGAPPIVEVQFVPNPDSTPTDISGEVPPKGQATEGNEFIYSDEGNWEFNLDSANYSAPGEYKVSLRSGDESQYHVGADTGYLVNGRCTTSFIIE